MFLMQVYRCMFFEPYGFQVQYDVIYKKIIGSIICNIFFLLALSLYKSKMQGLYLDIKFTFIHKSKLYFSLVTQSANRKMIKIGLLNVTEKYFIPWIISFGQTLKFNNYILCGYSYWRMNYILVTVLKWRQI